MNYRLNHNQRQGVIAPLFAFLLPVLLIMSAFAINMSYMQLTTTELKIASDASSHAGGRALTLFQNTQDAIDAMDRYARLNAVSGQQIVIPQDDAHMQFGQATIQNGRYEFTQHTRADVDSPDSPILVNSVRVFAEIDTPLAFRFRNSDRSFNPTRNSVTTQRDRDIAMVIDSSGSMLEYINFPVLDFLLEQRLNGNQISQAEFDLAKGGNLRVYQQYYTNNTLNELNQLLTLLDRNNDPMRVVARQAVEYALSYQENLVGPKTAFNVNEDTSLQPANHAGQDEINQGNRWFNRFKNGMVENAPAHSRWTALVDAMDGFFDVLERTDQEEQVALIVFNSEADAESILTDDYDLLRTIVADIVPLNGTQIGEGLQAGLTEVLRPEVTRQFAEKMIVVMTDGTNNPGGLDPLPVAQNFRAANPEAIIHTVTFGEGATQDAMIAVAEAGGGNHYHANDSAELAEEFREIANIPPTIFTF